MRWGRAQHRLRSRFPFEAPVADGFQDGAQGEAFFCKPVGEALGAVFGGDLFGELVAKKALQAVGEDVGRDAFGRCAEVVEY